MCGENIMFTQSYVRLNLRKFQYNIDTRGFKKELKVLKSKWGLIELRAATDLFVELHQHTL